MLYTPRFAIKTTIASPQEFATLLGYLAQLIPFGARSPHYDFWSSLHDVTQLWQLT